MNTVMMVSGQHAATQVSSYIILMVAGWIIAIGGMYGLLWTVACLADGVAPEYVHMIKKAYFKLLPFVRW